MLLLFWQYSPSAVRMCACAMGMGAGLFMNHSCGWSQDLTQTRKDCALRAALGVFGTISLLFLGYACALT